MKDSRESPWPARPVLLYPQDREVLAPLGETRTLRFQVPEKHLLHVDRLIYSIPSAEHVFVQLREAQARPVRRVFGKTLEGETEHRPLTDRFRLAPSFDPAGASVADRWAAVEAQVTINTLAGEGRSFNVNERGVPRLRVGPPGFLLEAWNQGAAQEILLAVAVYGWLEDFRLPGEEDENA